jgi:hypothetical protein
LNDQCIEMGEDIVFATDLFVDQMVLSFVGKDDVNLRVDGASRRKKRKEKRKK